MCQLIMSQEGRAGHTRPVGRLPQQRRDCSCLGRDHVHHVIVGLLQGLTGQWCHLQMWLFMTSKCRDVTNVCIAACSGPNGNFDMHTIIAIETQSMQSHNDRSVAAQALCKSQPHQHRQSPRLRQHLLLRTQSRAVGGPTGMCRQTSATTARHWPLKDQDVLPDRSIVADSDTRSVWQSMHRLSDDPDDHYNCDCVAGPSADPDPDRNCCSKPCPKPRTWTAS